MNTDKSNSISTKIVMEYLAACREYKSKYTLDYMNKLMLKLRITDFKVNGLTLEGVELRNDKLFVSKIIVTAEKVVIPDYIFGFAIDDSIDTIAIASLCNNTEIEFSRELVAIRKDWYGQGDIGEISRLGFMRIRAEGELRLVNCSPKYCNASEMFYCCRALEKVELGESFVISEMTSTSRMFMGDTRLTYIDLGSKFSITDKTRIETMLPFGTGSTLKVLKFGDSVEIPSDVIKNVISCKISFEEFRKTMVMASDEARRLSESKPVGYTE